MQNVAKSPYFQSFYIKLMLLRKTVISDFGLEVEILPHLHMRKEKMDEN